MKVLWAFIEKEFYHITRDTRSLIILIGMPVVQVIIFGFAITTEIKDAKISILDLSKDNVTEEINNKLLSSGYFKLDQYLDNVNQIEESFQKGKIKLAIIYDEKFAEKLNRKEAPQLQILADATDPNTATTLISYISAIVADHQKKYIDNSGIPGGIEIITRMEYNPQLKGVYLFVPGTITIILMLISAMMTSISIAREKEKGSMEVLLVSPVRPLVVIIGKVMPYIVLSFFNAVTIILLGVFVFGLPVVGQHILLMLEIILFIITSLALGILISTKVKTQQNALLISMLGLLLPIIILSGFIYPTESLPEILQYLSHLIPAKWFLIIIRSVMIKGAGLSYVLNETLILIGMMIFFIMLSVKNYKIRLE
jgi:ABC-2 type transport system permease protein